ncbi:kinase-like domain-containing protein [Rhizophagus irregularis DAOM 181602=DAOM 197198]|nr:kinase-like domain-containing protein [Rhizophagus irregularis DAOM 181602=DAOM 197198]
MCRPANIKQSVKEEGIYGVLPYMAPEVLPIKICKGFRPTISKDVPKLLAYLIIKCWYAEIENRTTTKELYQILTKWKNEIKDIEGGRYSNENKYKSFQTYPQAFYTSRIINFNNLPKPVNSSDLSSV